jgi:N-acetylglutamate synthase/N-acetylornithine aminotransferase
VVLNETNNIAAVMTQNRFCAAPVQITKQHLAANQGIRALVINTVMLMLARDSKGGWMRFLFVKR